jgi:hypothetical protein
LYLEGKSTKKLESAHISIAWPVVLMIMNLEGYAVNTVHFYSLQDMKVLKFQQRHWEKKVYGTSHRGQSQQHVQNYYHQVLFQ